MAKLSESRYLYTGETKIRSLREFQLLTILHGKGLPVPEPVAAWWKIELPFYQAAILLTRIENAVPFPEVGNLEDVALWANVGRTIRQFHDVGLDHVDLNCDNILVAADRVFLIDFDRCRLQPDKAYPSHWKKDNLSRLRRSVEKRCKSVSGDSRERLWRSLHNAYTESTWSIPGV